MKTNDAMPAPPTAGDPKPASAPTSLVICGDYREHDFEHWPRPSELDLARLAAQLARSENIDPKQLVAAAWELYRESCHRLQIDHLEVTAYHAQMDRVETEPDDAAVVLPQWVPAPKKYPVTHQQVERLLLPQQKGRTAERAGLIREYFFAQLTRACLVVRPKLSILNYWEMDRDVLEELRQKMKDNVTRRFEEYRKTVFDAEAYARFAGSFLEWRRRFIAAKKASAARSRWAKEEEKRQAAATAAAKAHAASKIRIKKSLGEG